MKIPIDQKYNEINLKELLPLFEELEYFVFFGTLLGLIRGNELLEYDDDIDFLINEKHLLHNLTTHMQIPYNLIDYMLNKQLLVSYHFERVQLLKQKMQLQNQ